MKKFLIIFSVCCLLVACGKKAEEIQTPKQSINTVKADENTINPPTQNTEEENEEEKIQENIKENTTEETNNIEYESLGEAAANGDIKQVRKLLDGGANINYMRPNDGTGWYCGEDFCEDSDEKVEQYFQYDRDNGTALMRAAYNGHLEVVKLLLDKGAKVNIQNEAGSTSLMKAAYNGHFEIVKLLIDKGASVNLKEKHGSTALIKSVARGHTKIVKLLLNKGADTSAADTYDCEDNVCYHAPEGTALDAAVSNGHIDIVQLLVDAGADINRKDKTNRTLLMKAAKYGYTEIVKLLIDAGANVNKKDSTGDTALHYATEYPAGKNTEIVKLLLDKGADVNAANFKSWTPLMSAANEGYLATVNLLLNNGADINAKSATNQTALDYVLPIDNHWRHNGETESEYYERLEELKETKQLLLQHYAEKGADKELVKKIKDDAYSKKLELFFNSIKNNDLEQLKTLIKNGIDVNVGDKDNDTALIKATWYGNVDIIKFLIESGANVNLSNNDGETPLMNAAENADINVVKILLNKGADVNAKDNDDETALIKANGHTEIAELLKAYGAKE